MQLNRVQRSLELEPEPEPEPSRQGPEALAVGSSGSAPQQQQPLQQQPSQQPAIAVCYEDEHLAVVWKPAGMPAIGGGARGEPSVSAALPSLFPASSASGASAAAGGDDVSGEGLAAEAEQVVAEAATALWLAKPGVGMQELLSKIQAQHPQHAETLGSRTAVKQVVRAAVASIPYRRVREARFWRHCIL